MTRSIALSILAQGNTGDEILSILDTLMSDQSAEVSISEPTADPIEFWYLWDGELVILSLRPQLYHELNIWLIIIK